MGNRALCCGSKSRKRKEKRENSTLASHGTEQTPRRSTETAGFSEKVRQASRPIIPSVDPQMETDVPWDTAAVIALVDSAKIELSALVDSSTSLPLLVNKPDMRIYGIDTHRGFLMKSTWEVPYPPRIVLDFELNNELRLQWDPNIAELRNVAHVTPEVTITYERYKKMMIVSQRDLLTAGRWYSFRAGILDCSVSIELETEQPLPDMVRARLFIGGFDIQPTVTGSTVSLYSEMDFGGAIPKSLLVRMSAMTLPGYIKAFREGIEKYARSLDRKTD